MKRLNLPQHTLYVKKTGLPFYDAARLIGVAHMFLGTAIAEIKDCGLFWTVSGPAVALDRAQVTWISDSIPGSRSRARLGDYSTAFAETSKSACAYFSNLNRILTEAGRDSPLVTTQPNSALSTCQNRTNQRQ